jgi:hypothetical protein
VGRPSLFFTDGVALDGDQFVFGAGLHEHRDSDSSAVGCHLAGEWGYHSVEDDFITSLTWHRDTRELLALGRNGLIKSAKPRGATLSIDALAGRFKAEQLPGVEATGPMERIRAIGSAVFACGWAGQVLLRRRTTWEQLELGTKGEQPNFMAIDGFAEDDVYAVGLQGVIWHYDGKRWRASESPTPHALYDVRCLGKDELVVCGADGGVFRGKGRRLRAIGDPTFEGTCWAVEAFEGRLYVTRAHDGLAVLERGRWKRVKLNAKQKRTTHRLSASPEALYSFGQADIVKFDGRAWHDVICPENT